MNTKQGRPGSGQARGRAVPVRPVRGPGLGPGRAALVLYSSWISWIYLGNIFAGVNLRGLFSYYYLIRFNHIYVKLYDF